MMEWLELLLFRNIIHVLRVPPVKTFFPHFLGLTVGFVAVVVAVVHLPYPLKESLLLLVIFGAGSWLGTLFVVIIAIVALSGLNSFYCPHLPEMAQLYLSAYIAGWAFGVAYNWLVFLLLVKWGRLRLSFAYNRRWTFNIIKSPIPGQQTLAELNIRRLYEFDQPDPAPNHPYTIAFVANPMINGRLDPILDDLNLFLHTVDRALQSFERDEVLGAAEIWSRVRVVTYFNHQWNQALVRAVNLQIGGQVPDRFLEPLPHMAMQFLNQPRNDPAGQQNPPIIIPNCEFDVIFALSAWPESCRSTALFSDYLQPPEPPDPPEAPTCPLPPAPPPIYATIPGRVALSIFSARTKTFIHEFAHAMSSVNHGAIADEYYDPFQVPPAVGGAGPACINRLQRAPAAFTVPVNFGLYNGVQIFSDMAHPSAEENWRSYFPERIEPGIPCTMDRSAGGYRFDRLITYFMYQQLCAKLNR